MSINYCLYLLRTGNNCSIIFAREYRGHESKAHRLVIEIPELVEKYREIAEYYSRLELSPSLLEQFPGIERIIELAKIHSVNPLIKRENPI